MRITPSEREEWDWCAGLRNESVSSWLRRLAREDVELRRAEESDLADRKQEQELTLQTAYPQGPKKCRHVSIGQFCYQCGRKRFTDEPDA